MHKWTYLFLLYVQPMLFEKIAVKLALEGLPRDKRVNWIGWSIWWLIITTSDWNEFLRDEVSCKFSHIPLKFRSIKQHRSIIVNFCILWSLKLFQFRQEILLLSKFHFILIVKTFSIYSTTYYWIHSIFMDKNQHRASVIHVEFCFWFSYNMKKYIPQLI